MNDSAKLQINLPELAPASRSEEEPVANSVRYVEVPLHDDSLLKEVSLAGMLCDGACQCAPATSHY